MSSELIFITGGTGFIGSQTALSSLKAGYRVRISVRKQEQIATLQKIFAAFKDKLDFVVVTDITKVDAFDAALKDVDHVFHLASPLVGKGVDVREDYVKPAVEGTLALLRAATQYPTIKTVIVTSSVVALLPAGAILEPVAKVKDNTGTVIPVDLDQPFSPDLHGHAIKYSISKILAHQATRDFLSTTNPTYRLYTVHPVFVLGENLAQTSAQALDGVNGMLWLSLFQEEKPMFQNATVHVRDVADAHIKILSEDRRKKEIPSGTEFLLSSSAFKWEDVAEFVGEKYPSLRVTLKPPFEQDWEVDTSTAEEYLGVKWRSMEEMTTDMIDQQLRLRGQL